MLTETDYRIRLEIYKLLSEGVRPSAAILAPKVRLPQPAVYESLERLGNARVVVLDPHNKEIKVAMPFSIAETPFRVLADEHTRPRCRADDDLRRLRRSDRPSSRAQAARRCAWCGAFRRARRPVVERHLLYVRHHPVLP
jgi:hypothetical protein